MISVINLGISNLSSVLNALEYLGIKYILANNPQEIIKGSHIILPGVGSFYAGMKALEEQNFSKTIKNEVLKEKKPILGICLGMQLLFESSQESEGVKGLNLLKGKVLKLPQDKNYPIPRIGWAESTFQKKFLSFSKNYKKDFYYLHSYYVAPDDNSIITISTQKQNITAAIQSQNILGCQFHPEKSHLAGLQILKDFSRIKA